MSAMEQSMKVPGITGCKMDMVQKPMLMEVRLAKMWLAVSSFPDGAWTMCYVG